MDQRVEALLRAVAASELDAVVASATGMGGARIVGVPEARDIVSVHGDVRTIGIVRLAGLAEGGGRQREWSVVAKVIDFNVPAESRNRWVRPDTEAAVYASGVFAEQGLGFRPARCHGVSHPEPGATVIWLEDLSAAQRAPFDLEQLAQMVRQLGAWNGANLQRKVELPFTPNRHSIIRRWSEWNFAAQLREFLAMRDAPEVRAMYGDEPPELAKTLWEAHAAFNARAAALPQALCFGDCNIGNLFCLPGETVAIDWASLTFDPLGVDAGSVIGSAITWGRNAMDVARNERALFECYLDGLKSAGWRGERDDVRRGYLFHYGVYMMGTAIFPLFLRQFDRQMVERRAEAKWEEIPALNAPLVELIPAYTEELATLA